MIPSWGLLALELGASGVRRVELFPPVNAALRALPEPPAPLREALQRYFRGEAAELDWPVELSGSAFERVVLAAVRRVGWGSTSTYGEIAREIGRPGAARAVGGALGRNPVPLFIPCHRILGLASLGGFSAPGGLDLKRRLLGLEGRGDKGGR